MKTLATISFTTFESPLGPMLATAERDALTGLYFIDQRYYPQRSEGWCENAEAQPFAALREQLTGYFAGERRTFELPLDPDGGRGTPFQRSVWDAIYAVPLGSTITYSALAIACGHKPAVRAAGAATGRNPISVIIPCHRIVGSDGSLTGYAGGLERKRTLLAFELAAASENGSRPLASFVAATQKSTTTARSPFASSGTEVTDATLPLPL